MFTGDIIAGLFLAFFFSLMGASALYQIFAKNKVEFENLKNGQVFVSLVKGDEKFLLSEISKKYDTKYKIITSNAGKYGSMCSVIIELDESKSKRK